jgi:hypothetical protein
MRVLNEAKPDPTSSNMSEQYQNNSCAFQNPSTQCGKMVNWPEDQTEKTHLPLYQEDRRTFSVFHAKLWDIMKE